MIVLLSREVKQPAQGHTAGRGLNVCYGRLTPSPPQAANHDITAC